MTKTTHLILELCSVSFTTREFSLQDAVDRLPQSYDQIRTTLTRFSNKQFRINRTFYTLARRRQNGRVFYRLEKLG